VLNIVATYASSGSGIGIVVAIGGCKSGSAGPYAKPGS